MPKQIVVSLLLVVFGAATAGAATVTGGSGILTSSQANQLESWLGEGPIGLNAIFSKTPGSTSNALHAAVDNKGRTFSVIELDNGNVIGGYNPFNWTSSNSYTFAYNSGAFLFNLTTGTKYDQSRFNFVAYNNASYGPTFGGGHDLFVNTSLTGGYANIGHTYGDTSRYGTTDYRNEFAGSYFSWTITKLDVFTIGEISVVPLPGSIPLLLSALGFAAVVSRRGKRRNSRSG